MSPTTTLCLLLIAFATPSFPAMDPPTPGNAGARAHATRGGKLIALTFDDGPKPYVLMGTRSGKGVTSQSLLALLDQQEVKATFFVMGWRLSKNADEKCRQVDGGFAGRRPRKSTGVVTRSRITLTATATSGS